MIRRWIAALPLVMMAACEVLPGKPAASPAPAPAPPTTPAAPTAPTPVPSSPSVEAPAPKPAADASTLRATGWSAIPGWRADDPQLVWSTFLKSCSALGSQPAWQSVCNAAAALPAPGRDALYQFIEASFTPYQVVNPDGSDSGLITGYYEPLLRGSRQRTAVYRYPLYGVPDDLLVIDLGDVSSELKNMRLRGRLEGRRVVPYYTRAQIEQGAAQVRGKEIVWVDDPVELFFLQIQGSGRIRLDSGDIVPIGYADQNGHPYRSIGRILVDRGELPLERASMQGIKAWAKKNPAKLNELLNANASYVFFRELPRDLPGPLGALGVPLTARRSIAVDPRFVPLGAPLFLATSWPNSNRPLNRLMVAQDTGGAIRGAVRGDFFWGFGEEAAALAGAMRQSGRMWVLLPNGYPVDKPGGAVSGPN